MTKETVKELMGKHCILSIELDDVFNFVEEVLTTEKERIKKEEPHAFNSIARLETAAREVWLIGEEIMEMDI